MSGIHHVTAIAGKPARNLEFYRRVLGLRFVKKTVNFDDPGTFHCYYGDEVGHPGTILTFFTWEHAAPGRAGVGLTQQSSTTVPSPSVRRPATVAGDGPAVVTPAGKWATSASVGRTRPSTCGKQSSKSERLPISADLLLVCRRRNI